MSRVRGLPFWIATAGIGRVPLGALSLYRRYRCVHDACSAVLDGALDGALDGVLDGEHNLNAACSTRPA
jgi:hypothetical protein